MQTAWAYGRNAADKGETDMKKLSARKITFLICAAAVLLCCLVTATVLTACKSEPAPPPQST